MIESSSDLIDVPVERRGFFWPRDPKHLRQFLIPIEKNKSIQFQ